MQKPTNELLLERLNNHIEEDDKRHEEDKDTQRRMFGYLKEMNNKLDTVLLWTNANAGMPDKVSKLWDFHMQNKGFLSATRLLTGGAGGLVGACAALFVEWVKK